MIRVRCGECGVRQGFDDEDAGERLECVECGARIRVPEPDESEEKPRRRSHRDDEDEEERDEPRRRRPRVRFARAARPVRQQPFELPFGMDAFGAGLAGLGAAWVLLGAVAIAFPLAGLVLACLGAAVYVFAALWMLYAIANEDGAATLLAYLFIPFYGLYYIVTNLDTVWRPLLTMFLAACVAGTGLALAERGGGNRPFFGPVAAVNRPPVFAPPPVAPVAPVAPPVIQPPVEPVVQPPPVIPPAVRPGGEQPKLLGSLVIYHVLGGVPAFQREAQIRAALAGLPGIDPASVQVAGNDVTLRAAPGADLSKPNDALRRLGFQVTGTTSRPLP